MARAPLRGPAEAGRGPAGGASYALRWRSESEAIDLTREIRFEGWTWLRASADTSLTTLFAGLDDSYITEAHGRRSFPASVVVDGYQDLVTGVATSWSTERVRSPEAPVFGPEGGNRTFIVAGRQPDDVLIRLRSRVSFAPPRWPVIEDFQERKAVDGGDRMVVKASAWVGRTLIFMFVRDGDRILSPSELDADDYLLANVSYQAPHLRAPIKDLARITALEPLSSLTPATPTARGVRSPSAPSA